MLQQITAHESSVNTIVFTGDQHSFVTGGGDGAVRLFDMRNQYYFGILEPRKIPQQQELAIHQVLWNQFFPMKVLVVLKNSSDALVLDIRKPNQVQTILQHDEFVNCAAWIPENNMLCTADGNAQTNIWQLDFEAQN